MKTFEQKLEDLRKELVNDIGNEESTNEAVIRGYLIECIDIAHNALKENKTPYQVIKELKEEGEIRLY